MSARAKAGLRTANALLLGWFASFATARAEEAQLFAGQEDDTDVPVAAGQIGISARPQGIYLPWPVLLDNREVATVTIGITPGQDYVIETGELINALKEYISPQVEQRLEQSLRGRRYVPVDEVDIEGLKLNIDSERLVLIADVSAGLRPETVIRLAPTSFEQIGEFDAPARMSGYFNLRSSLDYVHNGPGAGLAQPAGNFDGAARLSGVVLEAEGGFTTIDGTEIRRTGTRFVIDDPDRVARWVVGDLIPAGRGFQTLPQMAGVSVYRSYSELQPQRNVRPGGERSFVLTSPSTVEAFVNGISVRRIRLDPGTYSVRDFPFAQGSNNIDLRITDDTGRVETLSFSLFIDRALLDPGLTEYGAYAGVRAAPQRGDLSYSEEVIASGFIRRGFEGPFTAGLNFQASEDVQMAGAEALFSTPVGTVGVDVAASNTSSGTSGYAVNVGYNHYIQLTADRFRTIGVTAEVRSKDFGGVADVAGIDNARLAIAANYAQSLGSRRYASFSLDYIDDRLEGKKYSGRGTVGVRLTDDVSLQFDLTGTETRARTDMAVRVGLSYRFGQRSSVRAAYESRSDRVQLGVQSTGGRGVGAWAASSDLDIGSDFTSLNANGFYSANRAELSAAHVTTMQLDNNAMTHRSSARFGTSVAFADGMVGIGRPITNGFALFAPHESVKSTVQVDGDQRSYEAESGRLGAAVLPTLTPFGVRNIRYDAPDAPAGIDLGSGVARVMPPYKAGYAVKVGSDYSVSVIGRLVDEYDMPAALLSGTAYEVGGEERTYPVFTNRDGRFALSGLRPGKWRVELNRSGRPLVYTIDIPKTEESLIRIRDIRPD